DLQPFGPASSCAAGARKSLHQRGRSAGTLDKRSVLADRASRRKCGPTGSVFDRLFPPSKLRFGHLMAIAVLRSERGRQISSCDGRRGPSCPVDRRARSAAARTSGVDKWRKRVAWTAIHKGGGS